VLSIAILTCLSLTFKYPFAGVLTWAWITIMAPHREAYGVITSSLRLSFTVAIVTVLAWLFSNERKQPIIDGTFVVVVLSFLWITLNHVLFAVSPEAYYQWDQLWKILALGLMVGITANSKVRIQALIWVLALSLLYYGVRGGILNIMTGGNTRIGGPRATMIEDNNEIALALLMILPLVNYLRLQTANRLVRIGLIAGGSLTFLAVIASYSRGAFLALGVLAILGWARARNKFVYPFVIAAIAYPAFELMPQSYYDRINTISNLQGDESWLGRLDSWKVAYSYARDHFPFGAGFDGPRHVWNYYIPGGDPRAVHSIYFQVLGEHGFGGLVLYLAMLLLALVNAQKLRRAARNRPDLAWMSDLATMIQLSLVVFCVGGAALPMPYYDLVIIWVALLPAMIKLAQPATLRPAASSANSFRALTAAMETAAPRSSMMGRTLRGASTQQFPNENSGLYEVAAEQ
jgi:probable O-glycosylation ligase (exosortase A-associated)